MDRLALAGFFAVAHGLAEAADDAGGPAVVPVGGVFRGWAAGQVGAGPELVEPGQLPHGIRVVGPAGPDLAGEVIRVLGAEDGFDPVGQFAEALVALLAGHGEPEPLAGGGLVVVAEDGEDLLDLAAQFGDAVEHGGVLLLGAGEVVDAGGEGFDAAAQSVDPDGEGGDGGGLVAAWGLVGHRSSPASAGGSQ